MGMSVKELMEKVKELELKLEEAEKKNEGGGGKGRAGRKLSDDEVREIRKLWEVRGELKGGVVGIGKKFGISQMMVRNICEYKSVYRDVK